MNIDMEKWNSLTSEWSKIDSVINEYEDKIKEQKEKLKEMEVEVKKLLPKGYWWTCDIDNISDRPKKYSVKSICCYWNKLHITVKEVLKRTPWKSFDGEHTFSLDEFIELNIYKTEEEAKNRPCPKCGSPMGYTRHEWCNKCMNERSCVKEEFEKAHTFYDSKKR